MADLPVNRRIFVALFGLLGFLVPTALVFLNRSSPTWWWPGWIVYVWPSSLMLDEHQVLMTFTGYATFTVAALLNSLLYAALGFCLCRALRVR